MGRWGLLSAAIAGSCTCSALLVVTGWQGVALWVSMVSFATRAYVYLGRWPEYGRPDPKNLPMEVQEATIDLAVAAVVWLALSISTLAMLRRLTPLKRVLMSLFVAILATSLACGLLMLDPGGVIEWVID